MAVEQMINNVPKELKIFINCLIDKIREDFVNEITKATSKSENLLSKDEQVFKIND